MNLVHTDVFRRALPWSRLMLERNSLTDDLNVSKSERLRAALAGAALLSVFVWAAGWLTGWVPLALIAALIAANRSFIAFFVRSRGPLFALRAFSFHQLYYLSSSATFAAALAEHHLGRYFAR